MMKRLLFAVSAMWLTVSAVAQCVLSGFEGCTLGLNGAVMFRQPGFSGSTSGFLAFYHPVRSS